jgi:hypothetical protein
MPQPGRRKFDTAQVMNIDPFACVLWLGSLLAAADPFFDPLPSSLDVLLAMYLAVVRPKARA